MPLVSGDVGVQEVVQLAAGEFAVAGELGHVEENIAAGRVSNALGDQRFDEFHDLADVVRNLRFMRRRIDLERREVAAGLLNVTCAQFQRILSELRGPSNDLVIDVGEVADVIHLEAEVFQILPDDVEEDRLPRVTQVSVVIGGDAASVHADFILFERHEILGLSGQSRVESKFLWHKKSR